MKQTLITILILIISIYIYPLDNTADSIKLDVETAVKKGLDHNFSLKNNKIDLNVDKLLLATSWNNIHSNDKYSNFFG